MTSKPDQPPVRHIAVAAPHPAAIEAASEAIAAGGNAIDAALAAAAMLTVVYPHQCAIGGDLVALVRRPGLGVTAVVSVGASPADVDVDALAREDRMPKQGAQTVTVPGVVAGWRALDGLGSRLGLGAPLRGAARRAADGFAVSAGLARAIAIRTDELLADEGMRGVFGMGDGGLAVEGDRIVQPALAATLEQLAVDPDAMYSGSIGASIAARLRALGGAHAEADFAAHDAELLDPVEASTGGVRWWVAPPPTQGVVLLGILPEALGDDVAELVAAVHDAALVRQSQLGDPRGGPIDIDAMLAPRSREQQGSLPRAGRALGDTVAVTAADSDGTVVTLIQSVYQLFGSGILDPATGVVLHNRGSAFSTDPAHPGRIGPGLRPPHTLLPVIAETDELVLGLGCQGGSAQPWILAQVVAELLDSSADPTTTLGRSRFVIGARDLGYEVMTLVAEPGLPAAEAAARGRDLPVVTTEGLIDDAGHVQAVRLHADGRLDAASDPRADGRALVFDTL
ncbi:gamma-glutamyltransferase [Agreia bicolorata]|uniref:gamma-glutamyltransferase n=1 Tax=Agreia bicolorata TaxID=110935 RepID=UPI0005CA6058|nr:gamma-glutamyltransferase [Agreia bicolorata]